MQKVLVRWSRLHGQVFLLAVRFRCSPGDTRQPLWKTQTASHVLPPLSVLLYLMCAAFRNLVWLFRRDVNAHVVTTLPRHGTVSRNSLHVDRNFE
jgi:hypothetical protein